MAELQNFMRVPDPTPKRTLYTDAMEIFHRAADTIGLAPRVRLELEEPDYEHIFYVTAKLKDRRPPASSATFPSPRCAIRTGSSDSPMDRSCSMARRCSARTS